MRKDNFSLARSAKLKFAVCRSPFAVRVGFLGKCANQSLLQFDGCFLLEFQENARSQIDFAFSQNS